MADADEIRATLDAYVDTFKAHDKDRWLALFADDATQEDPLGAPVNTGPEAIGVFWDNTHALGDLSMEQLDEPIILGHEALMFLRVTIGHGAERMAVPRIVDHIRFTEDGRIQSLRAFWDPADIGPSPE
jgi:steroid delta-isomerase